MEKDATKGRERIAALFDEGSFVETGAYVKSPGRSYAGVVTGYGAVGGRLVFAFAQDSDRDLGAFDDTQAEKIRALYRMALENRAPLVGMFDSAGALVADGAGVLSAYGKVLGCVAEASGRIPQIALISGVATGLSATVAAQFDFIVTVEGESSLSVGAPFLLGGDAGSAKSAAAEGLSAIFAADFDAALSSVKELLSYLPSAAGERAFAADLADDPNREVQLSGLTGKALAETLSDGGRFFELFPAFAPEYKVGFARVGGESVGLVVSDASILGGALTVKAAGKIQKLLSFCNAYSVPVVTLVDSEGLRVTGEDGASAAAVFGSLASAYASCRVTKVSAVIGKAYGAVFTLLGSKGLGADLALALPTAEISVMAPATAVAFLWNDRITETCTREMLESRWKEEIASPVAAAADGAIDDIVAPAELRQRICSALYMGQGKRRRKCPPPPMH